MGVHAASINWGAPANISGDSDVVTNGTPLYACFRGGADHAVNGVNFSAQPAGQTWGNVSFSGFGSDYTAYNSSALPFGALSAAYTNVLAGGVYGGAAPGTVTLNGLAWGHSYAVQIWVNDARAAGAGRSATVNSPGGNTVTLDYNNINAAGGVGQYVVGTFVATGSSQTLTLTSSSSVQLNAINVRDNGYSSTFSALAPARFNLAKYQPVITDSTNGTQTASFITQGFAADDSCWISGNTGPHWAAVVFPFPVTVGSAQLAMGQKNASPMTVFSFQYLTNGAWVTVPGSSVSGNANVEKTIVFSAPVTSTSFRVYDSLDNPIRIRQMALYPPNGSGDYPFGADFSIDLARKQPTFSTTNSSGCGPFLASDGLVSPSSAWETTLIGSNSLLVNLQFTNKLGSAHLYSGATGIPPLSDFVLQYWTGSAWANVPGGSVSGNTNAALVIPFSTPVTTTKVQLVFTNAGAAAVQELCVFPANSNGGYPLGTGVVSNTPEAARYDTFNDSFYYLSNSAAGSIVVESNGLPVLGTGAVTNWAGQYQILLNYDTGTYRVINRLTGLCLAGAQMTTNAGSVLVDEPYSALPDQDWILQNVDGVNFYLVNQFSGLAIDEHGGGLVQNIPTNSATQLWQLPLAQIFPKKGIAGVGNFAGSDRRVVFAANWSYSWWYSTSAPLPPAFNYYPMDESLWYRGATVANNIGSLQPGWRTAGHSLYVLGYNEPDMVGQADIDATNGAIGWLNDQNLDLPLTAPAAGNVNGTWNATFYGYITNWGCRVDYLPAHEYVTPSGGSSATWINPLQTAYNTYGFPMWMTEFGIVDWAGDQSWTEEDNYNALAEFMWRAEQTPWLRKYALFLFQAATNYPMAPNPWTATTPAPRSNSYDTNGVLTPFGELYAAWDDDANVETNKQYYIHNSGTRKRLQNTSASAANATDIRVSDYSTKWTLVSAGIANLYYIVSALDGRRLSYTSGGSVSLVASNVSTAAVQWSLTPYQYGWFYVNHPATGLRLQLAFNNSTGAATFTMVASTTTSTAVQWRFIVPLPPPAWTGYSDDFWTTPGNWSSQQTPSGQAVTFNNLSTSNLNTVLSSDFKVSSLVVTAPAGPVSIGGTSTLTLGSGIDLSAASQSLAITAPLALAGNQTWNVAGGQSLNIHAGISDNGLGAGVLIGGGGVTLLGGTASYGGGTVINTNSTLEMTAANALPNGTNAASNTGDITNNGTLDLNSTAQAVNGLSGSGVVDNTASGIASLTIGVNNDGGNFAGTIQDTGGNLTLIKNGSATEVLRGTNSYAGGTIVNGGAITFYNTWALGAGPVTVNGGVILGSGNFAITNPVTLNSGTLRVGGGASHALTNLALVTVTGNSVVQADGGTVNINLAAGLDMGDSGNTLTNSGGSTATIISGPLTGGPSGSIFVTLSEVLVLSSSNSFAGTFREPAGTLSIQNPNALRNATLDMSSADAGSVNFNNNNVVLGALTGARNLTIGSGAVSVGNNNASTVYSGAMLGAGSLTKVGSGTLTLSGTNGYTGNTVVAAGTLVLSGIGALASSTLSIAGNATLDVSGLTTTFGLGGRTLTNISTGALLAGNSDCSVGSLSLLYNGVNPPIIVTNGTMTLSSGTAVKINNVGSTLAPGSYPVIAAAMTGNPGLVTGTLPPVVVSGNGASGAASLQFNLSGLNLVVASSIASNPTNITYTLGNGTLTLSWPGDHLGWIAQSNVVDISKSNFWFDILGSQSATNLVAPISSGSANVFYRLRSPN